MKTIKMMSVLNAVSQSSTRAQGSIPSKSHLESKEATSVSGLDLATCSVQELASAFQSARAFAALASAKVTADRAVARTQTLAFISLIGR